MRRGAFVALMLIGCGSTTPAARLRASTPTVADSPFAAFLAYDGTETVLLPVQAGREAITAEGLWVVAPDDPDTVIHVGEPNTAAEYGLRSCACTSIDGACIDGSVRRSIRPRDGFAVAALDDCACWASSRTADAPMLARYRGDDDAIAPCTPEPSAPDDPSSFVGGILYTLSTGSSATDECGRETGRNVYDAWVTTATIFEGGSTPAPVGPWRACTRRHLGAEELFGPEGALASPECTPAQAEADAAELGENDYDSCAMCAALDPDGSFYVLKNGSLCAVDVQTVPFGADFSWVVCEPARPSSCPSPLDPCGDPSPFDDVLADAGTFWISTDGRFALVDGAVYAPGTDTPIVDHGSGSGGLGVLFIEDASSLAAAMTNPPTPGPETPELWTECESDDECDGGFCGGPFCTPFCEEDQDCDRIGICGAACHDGRCGPPEYGCSESHPCYDGFHCVGGDTCVACLHDGVCDDGVCDDGSCESAECEERRDCAEGFCVEGRCITECSDTRGAREYGSECASEMRAERWDAAETACRCALGLEPPPRVEGALRYNLGRIAEGRERPEEARLHYQRSLELRPGNAIVQARLAALDE